MRPFLRPVAAALALSLALATPLAAQDALRVGETFLTAGLDPAKGSNGWALISHGVGEQLFTVDAGGRLVPELAAGAERLGPLEWRVTLAEGRAFSDGSPVTAEAVAAGLTNTVAKNPVALATAGMLGFEAESELVLKVTTERPVPVIEALFAEWPMIVYKPGAAAGGAGDLFTGPYAIAGFAADTSLSLVPNPHYPGAAGRAPVELRRIADAQALALAYEAGELDLAFGLPSEVLPRLQADPELTVKSFPVGYQYFAFLNTSHDQLADRRVRQAIDLGLDRGQLVAAINGGTPATGAFAPYFPFAPAEARPSDAARAEALLDEAGWLRGADGMRARDGQALRVKVLTYPSRPDLVTMLPVVKAQLAGLGIAAETGIVENAGEVAAQGDFDLFLWAQHTAPTGDPAFFLGAMLASEGPQNYARYDSPDFDAILARFSETGDAAERAQIALEAQALLFEDVPVSFLVSPDWHVGLSPRLGDYQPWGSDYHVIRADMGEVR